MTVRRDELLLHAVPAAAFLLTLGSVVLVMDVKRFQTMVTAGVAVFFTAITFRVAATALWVSPTRQETDCGYKPKPPNVPVGCCCADDTFLLLPLVAVARVVMLPFGALTNTILLGRAAPWPCFCSEEFHAKEAELDMTKGRSIRFDWYKALNGARFYFWAAARSQDPGVVAFVPGLLRLALAEEGLQHLAACLLGSCLIADESDEKMQTIPGSLCIAVGLVAMFIETSALLQYRRLVYGQGADLARLVCFCPMDVNTRDEEMASRNEEMMGNR